MESIQLIRPTIEYGAEIMLFRAELLAAADSDAFAGCGSLRQCETAGAWLSALAALRHSETGPAGMTPADTYLAVRFSDGRIVGIIDLRHHIRSPVLSLWGGHMGYTVRPSERGKGYAKQMLRLNLENCRKRNMDRVMITCSRENTASERTILANGGVLEKEIEVDGQIIKRYWITL